MAGRAPELAQVSCLVTSPGTLRRPPAPTDGHPDGAVVTKSRQGSSKGGWRCVPVGGGSLLPTPVSRAATEFDSLEQPSPATRPRVPPPTRCAAVRAGRLSPPRAPPLLGAHGVAPRALCLGRCNGSPAAEQLPAAGSWRVAGPPWPTRRPATAAGARQGHHGHAPPTRPPALGGSRSYKHTAADKAGAPAVRGGGGGGTAAVAVALATAAPPPPCIRRGVRGGGWGVEAWWGTAMRVGGHRGEGCGEDSWAAAQSTATRPGQTPKMVRMMGDPSRVATSGGWPQ